MPLSFEGSEESRDNQLDWASRPGRLPPPGEYDYLYSEKTPAKTKGGRGSKSKANINVNPHPLDLPARGCTQDRSAELDRLVEQKRELEHQLQVDNMRLEIQNLKLSLSSKVANTSVPPAPHNPTVPSHTTATSVAHHDMASFLDRLTTLGHGEKTKNVKSGMEDKPTDVIVKKLRWPHTCLKFRFSQGSKFEDLDLALLSAGELAVIANPATTDPEKKGRLALLSSTAGNSRMYEWEAVRSLHGACLGAIERGDKQWGDSFADYEPYMLYQHPLRSPAPSGAKLGSSSAPTNRDLHWYCSPWQTGDCPHKQVEHEGIANGQTRTVKHMCKACYRHSREVKGHPESSEDCPLK